MNYFLLNNFQITVAILQIFIQKILKIEMEILLKHNGQILY